MASQPQGRGKPKAPIKAKLLQGLRNTHAEQLSKLQQKYQFEQDLLEDVRAYCKQRSAIEKDYAQNLQKLNTNFLQKRVFASQTDTDATHRLPDVLWKQLLEESDNYSKKRMEISDGLQTQVAEEIKAFKANKAQVFKKCQDLTQKTQEEVFDTIREMSKSKKSYIEAEKLSQVAGEQAADAEDKFKKKNTKFFQSKATLEKNRTKSSSRKEFSEVKATSARNEYLLNLAASNAHMTRYYCSDLQQILDTVYGTFYETIREYFQSIGQLEAGAATHAKNGFENLLSEAKMIEKDYCVQKFLENSPVFTKVINYDFEPCRKDKISKLCLDGNPGVALNKEARKLAMRLVREQKTIKENQRILSGLKSTNPSEVSGTGEQIQDPEQNPENIKEAIRHAELIKLKSEACLDLMRDAGVNVEEWLKSANSLSVTSRELSGSQSSLDSSTAVENTDWNDDDEWDIDDTFVGNSDSDEDANSLTSSGSLPIPCFALYNFEASNTDELSIVENEELEVLEKDSDGWCKGRNKKGEIGYFPESYVEFRRTKCPSITSNHSSSINSGSFTDGSLGASPARAHSISSAQEQSYICLVRALFDYDAIGDDEISFSEGDIIQVTKKDDNGVDDGFWEGQVNGKFGVFPSLLVEEIEGSEPTEAVSNTLQSQESIYSVLPSTTTVNTCKPDDYIELPKDYVPGACHTTANSSPSSSPYLQPKRIAPPPPSKLDPVDRRRVQTENVTTMNKPELNLSYQRATSHEYPTTQSAWNSKVNRSLSADAQADYVNVCDLPEGNGTSPNTGSGKPPKPPKPPPPTANRKSTSYV